MRSATTLKDELVAIGEPANAAAVAAAWATAFDNYFADAASGVGGAVPYTPQAAAKTAMQSALIGLGVFGNTAATAAAVLAAAVTAYWTALAPLVSAAFSGSVPGTLVPPAALGSLATALETTFGDNKDDNLSVADSMQNIADDIHTACNGGTASFPPPPAGTPQAIV